MKVLLIGGGGREDALAWALTRSPLLDRLDCAPGNAGIAERASIVDLSMDDPEATAAHAARERYDLVIVGPEAPLVDGLADALDRNGIPCFGPSAAAARIEGSKIFSKELMARHGIPTAAFRTFEDPDQARAYVDASDTRYPLVVKADGLAAGKGVILADDARTARQAVDEMMLEGRFGDAGRKVLIEDCLFGREASFFVLTDGQRVVELATCQDYKRALDGDRGLNTGGMGAYSPSVYLDDSMRRRLLDEVVQPTILGLRSEGIPYRGVLFVGVMLTEDGPRVLEFNARFGDPETQVLLPRLDGDWLPLLHGCAVGRLPETPLRWREEAAVCVVLAAGGYPGAYRKGLPIVGVDQAQAIDGVEVFHAGTGRDSGGRLITTGGRVLGVTALGRDLAQARERAYTAADLIGWDDEQHRNDIAADAIERSAAGNRR